MEIFLFAFIFFVISIGLMALGVIYGRAPLRGSCGGLSADGVCQTCQGDLSRCRSNRDNADNPDNAKQERANQTDPTER